MTSRLCIKRRSDGKVLVEAGAGQYQRLEGKWYVHASCVDKSLFETSDRIYSCPEKGVCYWVDFKGEVTYVNDVSWIYPEPKPGFEKISGWYGFYPHHKYYDVETYD